MEEAFLRFEVEVVELRHFENIVNCTTVNVEIGTGGDADVVHVDANGGTEGFMLEDDVAIYKVHHGLEGRWRVGKSEIHDCGFEEAVSGFKCRFRLVPFTDAYVVIPPSDIELCVDVCVAEIVDKICDEGKRVLIANCEGINFSVVLYRS